MSTPGTLARGHVGTQGTSARGYVGTQGTMAPRARRERDLADSFWKNRSFPCRTSQKSIFYNMFIRCLWLRLIRRPDYGLVYEFSFTDIFQRY